MKFIKQNTQEIIEGTKIGNVFNRVERIIEPGIVFGIVMPGATVGAIINGRLVNPGEYFCMGTSLHIEALECSVTYFLHPNKIANEIVAGKISHTGNQRYIDGCTDSLLVCPSKLGEPCLNALYFPPCTVQTFHTHPSLRCGIVLRGSGVADTHNESLNIKIGDIWAINTNERHRFRTIDDEMVVVAYHPDSDWGPTDEKHPMINRTLFGDNSEFIIYNFI